MNTNNKATTISDIKSAIGDDSNLIVKEIIIGKRQQLDAVVIYINGLVNKDMIDMNIMSPLMFQVDEEFDYNRELADYLCKKYISVSNTNIETDLNNVIEDIKRGKTAVIIEGLNKFIIADTTGGPYRSITEPPSDVSLRGPREGFIENLETNLTMLKRRIKDRNLRTEKFTLGTRSQTDLAMVYIDDIVDKEYLKKIKEKVKSIDIDSVYGNSIIEQCIEEHTYSLFPPVCGSERPDVIQANLLEGRIAFILQGTSYVTVYPSTFFDFFQTIEDYYGRMLQANFIRIVRMIAVFAVTSLPAIYISFIKFNAELIPIEFVQSLIQSRKGIALTPFMSLLAMNFTIELLREGGYRLPNKIGQTLSVVGGIIIGDAALKAKIVSSTTLLVAGITTVAAFVISNYQMSVSIRLINYPMLILANWLGMLGIIVGWFFMLAYLCAMENFGVPYFSFNIDDIKDVLLRVPIWKMNKRPSIIPNKNPIRQKDFRGGKNE
ncbi:spore germination protein [Clostridium felsineum]|uniref:spore germination protein n=1 Tax=Clostridium felsineum TaxID=36839 RepID=UPI0009D4F77F|nr:spore germination protein [Clostridium felsineum]URZ17717.1 Spore germination protein B1 [Clostridium felsineum DSM 794]